MPKNNALPEGVEPPVLKNNKLLPCARELRKEMTPQERRLWYGFLRDYPVKIYKQASLIHSLRTSIARLLGW